MFEIEQENKNLEGFTLVELLVVIFIIGLLTSFFAGALISYRNKAKDVRVEAVLSQVRKEATLIYNENDSYNAPGNELCAGDDTINDGNLNHPDLAVIEADVQKFNGNQNVECYSNGDIFCVQSPLVAVSGSAYCVDSIGYAGRIANCASGHISCQ